MLRLQILGQAQLTAGGGSPVHTIAIQPKLLALLAYVAAGRRHAPPRRDTLLGMFWPEVDAPSGRHALSQALSALRAELGPGVLDGKWREAVALEPGGLWCDVVAFREACAAGKSEAALALYGGPLLAGFFLSDAPEFERWVEDERHALQQQAVQAALALAETARIEERWQEGCRWSERALALDPYAEPAWRELIACLCGADDRAGAMVAFRRLTERLRDDLGVEPSPETVRLIEAMRARARGGSPAATAPVDAHQALPTASGGAATGEEGTAPPVDSPADPASGRGRPSRWRSPRALGTIAVVFAAIAGGGWWAVRHRARIMPALDPDLIAIVPFSTTGLDSSLAGLEIGMVDLLGMKLQGVGNIRAVDRRALLYAWDRVASPGAVNLPLDSMLHLAAHLGAGRLLTGGVVATRGLLSLNALVYSVPDGRARGRATVVGPADSLIQLTDRLAAKVLGLAVLEEDARIETLASTSLDAVRAYLAGLKRYRSGQYLEALREYERALAIDTTFALAAMGVMASADWAGDEHARGAGHRADQLAWAYRHRLGPLDSLRLLSFVGFRRPGITLIGEQIALVDRANSLMPQDPELRYQLGEQLLHQAPLAGIPDWRPRATAAMARAVRLDSSFPAPWLHLVHLAADAGDTATLRRVGNAYLARFPDEHEVRAIRWLLQAMLRDGPGPREPLERLDDLSLTRVVILSQSFGVSLPDAEQALSLLHEHAASPGERARVSARELSFALARGRPEAARRAWHALLQDELDPWFRRMRLRSAIYAAFYADGSTAAGEEAYRLLAADADQPVATEFPLRSVQLPDICAVELWRLNHGETGTAPEAIQKLRTAEFPRDPVWHVREAEVCTAVVETMLTEARGRFVDSSQVERLDSVLTAHPLIKEFGPPPVLHVGNLLSARLWANRGQLGRALASLQRRGHTVDAVAMPPAFLLAECRVAMRAGELTLATRACERFLALRSAPERSQHAATSALQAEYDVFRRNLSPRSRRDRSDGPSG